MSVQTDEYLKSRFAKGAEPTEQDYIDLIDSMRNAGSLIPAIDINDLDGVVLLHLDAALENITGGAANANLTTVPDSHVFTYFLEGGAGTYANFLSAAATPITLTAPEIAANAWKAILYPGATYWVKKQVVTPDISGKANQTDMVIQQQKTSWFNKLKDAVWHLRIDDVSKRLAVGVSKSGKFFAARWWPNQIPSSALQKDAGIDLGNLKPIVQKGILKYLDPRTGFLFGLYDKNNRPYMAARKNGAVYIPKLEFTPADNFLGFSKLDTIAQSMVAPFAGKKLFTLGDSITWYKKWQALLAQITGMIWSSVETTPGTGGFPPGGIGGSTILPMIVPDGAGGYVAGQAPTQSIYYRAGFIHNYTPDVIILFGGTNDNIPTGEVVDYSDAPYTGDEFVSGVGTRPTFVSAYKGTLLKLVTLNPNARIFAMTRMYNETNLSAPDYANYQIINKINDVIRECCHQFSIPVIDLQREVGINTINANGVFYMDNIHPNDEGGKRMARVIANKIC